MFDIGFSELLVIGVVALVVIGPEKLPRVARTVGHLLGRLQRYVADVKSDIQREAELDELRRMRETVESAAGEIERSVSADVAKVEDTVNSAFMVPDSASKPELAAQVTTPKSDSEAR